MFKISLYSNDLHCLNFIYLFSGCIFGLETTSRGGNGRTIDTSYRRLLRPGNAQLFVFARTRRRSLRVTPVASWRRNRCSPGIISPTIGS